MKLVKDLISKRKYKDYRGVLVEYYNTRSTEESLLKKYGETLAVAYIKNSLGSVVLIKGKRAYFILCFVEDLLSGNLRYNIERIETKKGISFLINNSQELIIQDENAFGELNKKIVVDKL